MPSGVSGRFESSGQSLPRSSATPCRIRYSSSIAISACPPAARRFAPRSAHLDRAAADRARARVSRSGMSRRAASTASRSAGNCDDVAPVQVTALVFDQARQDASPASGVLRRPRGAAPTAATWCCRICRSCRRPSASWTRLITCSVSRARRGAALVGDLERVAQLLRGDPDLVQRLRRVDLPGLVDGLVEAARPLGDAQRERRAPAVRRRRVQQRLADGLEAPARACRCRRSRAARA